MTGWIRFIGLYCLLSASAICADEGIWERLQIHGFASQAALKTSANRFFGDSSNTSFDFTELGLNLSYRLTPRVLVSGQVLARRAGDMYDGSPSLDYALIDTTLLSSADHRVGVRAGRIKNPLGLYNETRDVPFTRPGIFLPQVIYYDKVRNLMLSSDGIAAYAERFGSFGNLSLVLQGGQAVIDENVEWTLLGRDFNGEFDADGLTGVWRLWYSTQDERVELGFSGITTAMKYKPRAPSLLRPGKTDVLLWIASFRFNEENWNLSAEYSRIPIKSSHYGPYFPFPRQTSEGYYLQGAYRILPSFELMARYEEGYADRNDRSGEKASDLTGGQLPPYDFYAKIWTAGARWDINQQLMLRAEYQRHQGTFSLSFRENQDPDALRKHWDLFSVQLSIRF